MIERGQFQVDDLGDEHVEVAINGEGRARNRDGKSVFVVSLGEAADLIAALQAAIEPQA